jgi:hypothetical protein
MANREWREKRGRVMPHVLGLLCEDADCSTGRHFMTEEGMYLVQVLERLASALERLQDTEGDKESRDVGNGES